MSAGIVLVSRFRLQAPRIAPWPRRSLAPARQTTPTDMDIDISQAPGEAVAQGLNMGAKAGLGEAERDAPGETAARPAARLPVKTNPLRDRHDHRRAAENT